jgi:hypothetical protein
VKGLDQTLKNLNKKILAVKGVTLDGLLAGGLIVQRDAQQHVPVEYGVLRQSAYTRKARGGDSPTVEVGFSAHYAPYVHENLEMKWRGLPRKSGKGVYWGPKGEARFLANAVDRQTSKVVEVIEKRAAAALKRSA